ncbi:hypothetical protein [Sinorhizobium medicae]
MTRDYADLLQQLKQYRRDFVFQLHCDLSPSTARQLAETQMAILAVEAVMAEPKPVRTGPIIEFGEDGYPK